MKRRYPYNLPNLDSYTRQGKDVKSFSWLLDRRNIMSTIYGKRFP